MISSVGVGVTSAGGTGTLYIDKSDDNYGIGESLTFHADAENNIAIGANAFNDTTGNADDNIAIGNDALTALTAGSNNTVVGVGALKTADSGETNNVAIGHSAMQLADENGNQIDQNIAIGTDALKGGVLGSGAVLGNIAIGYQALKTTGVNPQTGTIAIGSSALAALTSGVQNTVIGYQAADGLTTGAYNTVLGYDALGNATTLADHHVAIGRGAMSGAIVAEDVNFCVAVGDLAMSGALDAAASGSVAVGRSALAALTGGAKNTAIGYNALAANIEGDNNVAIGYEALDAMVGQTGEGNVGDNNIAIGVDSMGAVNAGVHADARSDKNVAVGTGALTGGVLPDADTSLLIGNVAIGYHALTGTGVAPQTGTIAIGYNALESLTSGGSNVAVGYQALKALTTGDRNIAIGKNAMDAVDRTESDNIAIGSNAMGAVDEGSGGDAHANRNVAIGSNALLGGPFGSSDKSLSANIAIGDNALASTSTNAQTGTIAIGYTALTALTSGVNNLAIGYLALQQHTTGARNIAIGAYAMSGTAGDVDAAPASTDNVFIGYTSGGGDWENDEDSNFNVGIGNYVMDDAMDGAGSNTAVGHGSMGALTEGDNNVAVGTVCMDSLTTGTNNTCVGYNADTSAVDSVGQIAIGADVACIGDNIATLGIAANTASIGLDGSDTSWAAASSDERYKENIESSSAGLSFIEDLRPVTYNWKKAKDVQEELPLYKEGSEEPVLGNKYGETLHGFIAQEVKEAIDKHSDIKEGFKMWKLKDDGIQTVADGAIIPILVKAIQELSAQVEELKNK